MKKSIILSLLLTLTITNFTTATPTTNQTTTRYYRQLVYNQVSPHMEIKGAHEINQQTATKVQHYVFIYNADGKLQEIINHHFVEWDYEPLTHLGAVARVKFTYSKNTETRTFYDRENQPIPNLKGVYQEVFTYDQAGRKIALDFKNLKQQPMQSEANIAKYRWSYLTDMIIEQRYNLNNSLVALPYYDFLITGIIYDQRGLPSVHYNLDENYQLINNARGMASYQDTYDENLNHVECSYYDQNNKPALSSCGNIKVKKDYDLNGNMTYLSGYNPEGQINEEFRYSYDETGRIK